MTASVPGTGRLAGIDYGTVRIGVALSDARQTLASPLDTYTRSTPDRDAAYFRRLADEEQVVGFVVGLPVHLDGGDSGKSVEARRFGEWLGQTTGRPVVYFDERFTTAAALEQLTDAGLRGKRRKSRLDRVAAQVMLAAFLDTPRDRAGDAPRGLGDR